MPNATLNTSNTDNAVPAKPLLELDAFNAPNAMGAYSFQPPNADAQATDVVAKTRMDAFKMRLNAWMLNDNAAFIPTLLVSLLLLLILAILSAKGYSKKPSTLADAMTSPHTSTHADASAADLTANANDSSFKHSVVLPPEPTVRPTMHPASSPAVATPSATAVPATVVAPTASAALPVRTVNTSNVSAVSATADYARTFKQGCDVLVRTKAAIQFEPRTNYLNAASKRSLEPLLTCFKGHAVRISGHTDSIGTPDRKLEVSQLRAGAIKEYLISQGVPAAQLQATGMSDSKPLADNETPEGRAKNRRIEFVLEALAK
jgi:outer membrane protein OmpA-like peptidoglycan-associated protein